MRAQYHPEQAAVLWEECLKLLPPESEQFHAVQMEIARLRSSPQGGVPVLDYAAPPENPQETLPIAILKTGASMLVSIFVYQYSFGWAGAAGFVFLILIHELGHVVANLYYGLRASPPIFIPYVGAVINLRQSPPNAKVEAIIGIAGPIAGTIAALAAFAIYLATGSELALELSWFGFTMNLFNLLPVPPLDGGRVTAAVSPWVWIVGLAGLGWMLVDEFLAHRNSWMLLAILVFALPRIVGTLKAGGRSGPYYAIGKIAPIVIGVAYLILLLTLIALRLYTSSQLGNGGLF